MDHDISDHETPELPQVAVRCLCIKKSPTELGRGQEWSRLSAPEELTSPVLMDHHPADAVSSELPQFPVWGRCVPAPPFRVHHDPSDAASSELPQVAVDDVDGNEKITDPFRSRTRMVSIKRPRRANFTAFDGLPPIRHRIFRITSIPGQRPLCGELQPDCKSTMPSERPLDVPGLSAPEELSLPLESHRDLCDTAFSELPRAPV
ncbi:hypothetical protein Cantr_02065 [Candida viswanathii]|uniref:Uncharacterized protein n=1 Tax=Candida viswanathii TaxID=5486 RepID=A0A367YKI7_9ASCO|nr:hypothetical protein Cantr_02065 [Candida viswanathii]